MGAVAQRIRRATSAYLNAAARRYVDRVAAAMTSKSTAAGVIILKAPVISEILSDLAERQEMRAALGPAWIKTWVLAATSTARSLPMDLVKFDPDRPEVVRSLDGLIVNATKTQSEAVQLIVESELAAGASIGQIQESIKRSVAFGPSRALRIARTEATRAVNEGTLTAYQEAENQGIQLEKVWLSAPDARETHLELNEQTRPIDEDFVIPSTGDTAPAPGQFNIAGEDINCRCALSNKVLSNSLI